MVRLLAAVTLTMIGTAAAAREPLKLEPSSKWDIDYGAERCSLNREFVSDDAAVHLQIDSYGSWNLFRVILAGTAIPRLDGPFSIAKIRLTGDPADTHVATLQGSAGKAPAISFNLSFVPYVDEAAVKKLSNEEQYQLHFELSRPRPQFDATVETIAVVPTRGRELVLQVGNMGPPLVAMRACVDDMFRTWGQDPEVQKALSRPAKPLPSTVKNVQADYPKDMLLSGINAYVPIRLAVDGTGKATDCVVQAETIDKAFKQAVCEHLAGEFKPAVDKDGQPVASIYSTSVIYRVAY